MDKQTLKAFVEKKEGKKMVAIATDQTVDRHGDSLGVEDWDFKNFKKNPVLQFAHNYDLPPIGLAKNLKRVDDTITFEPEFHEFTQLAREVKKLFDEGIMKAFSVGFIPHRESDEKSGEPKMRLELLEISAVPIPANPAALVIEKSIKAGVTDEEKEKVNEWQKTLKKMKKTKNQVQPYLKRKR